MPGDFFHDRVRHLVPPLVRAPLTPAGRRRFAAAAPLACCAAAGCGGPLSILDPAGVNAAAAAELWWIMLIGATAIFVAVMAVILAAFTPLRRHLALPDRAWLVGGGLVFPTVTLAALLVYALIAGDNLLPHGRGAEAVRVDAVARQWQWTFRYPDAGGTASSDRLYLPAGLPVDVHVSSEDVIHSFWVPRLAGKIDAVPGHVSVIRLVADAPGIFGGQCSEFCGIGHAGMTFTAEVLPPEAFARRLAGMAAAARGDAR